jgi:hypothetical protein
MSTEHQPSPDGTPTPNPNDENSPEPTPRPPMPVEQLQAYLAAQVEMLRRSTDTMNEILAACGWSLAPPDDAPEWQTELQKRLARKPLQKKLFELLWEDAPLPPVRPEDAIAELYPDDEHPDSLQTIKRLAKLQADLQATLYDAGCPLLIQRDDDHNIHVT